MYKTLTAFLNLLINQIFFHIFQNFLKIHQLNIIKITKKDYKEKLVKDIKFFLKKKKKKNENMVAKIQKSPRR